MMSNAPQYVAVDVSKAMLDIAMPGANWTCNGLVPVACLSLCHLSFESQGAYAAQI
jgi:hypothetical protein